MEDMMAAGLKGKDWGGEAGTVREEVSGALK
jgi:hypothetical protein